MSSDQPGTKDRSQLLKRLANWMRAFLPLLVVVGIGSTYFREAVVESILSTPHPELVYTIFGVWVITAVLSAVALWRFDREERLAMHLRVLEQSERPDYLQSLTWKSEMQPVYDAALKPDFNQGLQVLQQKIETEMFSCEEHLLSRMDLPNYLSGSLVGIGLVGTFIGLLVSLTDLGTLLSGLMGSGGNSSDPVAMFSNMMSKLQKPMKGMGIAFLASLYGLMGSLIMGLVLNSVRKTGNQAITKVRELLRSLAEQFGDEARDFATMGALSTPAAMERMLITMQQERASLSTGLNIFSDAINKQSNLIDLLHQRVDVNTRQIRELEELLSELRNFSRHLVKREKRASSGNVWLRIVSIVLTCTLLGCLVISTMAVRSSEQLTRQIAIFLKVAEQKKQAKAPVKQVIDSNKTVVVNTEEATDSIYVVVRGDNLAKIAILYGVDLRELLKANPALSDPDQVVVGQKIRLPIKDARNPK